MADNDDDNPNGHDYYGEHQRRVKLQVWNRLQNRNNSDPFALSVTEFQRLFRMPQNFAHT